MIYQPKKKCILNQTHWEKERRNYYKKSQCTILLYYPIERSKNARYLKCECACYYILCPHTIYIYTLCTHAPIIPPFDIPREYIWKKNHQIYLSLYLANLLFFSFVQVYVILSVLIFHTYDIIFKIRFGGPTTKYTKQFLHSGKNLQYFVSFQKKKKRSLIFGNIVYFLAPDFF